MDWKSITFGQKILVWILIALATLVTLFPFMYLISLSLGEFEDTFKIIFWPLHFKWQNYVEAWNSIPISTFYKNSLIVAGMSVCLSLVVGAPAAYAFAQFKFKGQEFLYTVFLLGMMIPAQSIVIPLFLNLKTLNLLNNYFTLGLVYPSLNLAFTIFILRGFFQTLPRDIADAATIDGCTPFQAFLRIMLPLSRPGLAAVALFQFIWSWDEFLLAYTFIIDENKMTLPAGLAKLQGEYFTNYPVLGAALILSSVAIILFYLLAQRQFVQGLTLGAIKE